MDPSTADPSAADVASATRVATIDLTALSTGSPSDRRQLADAVDSALRSLGFLIVTGHGVPEELIDDTRELARSFFDRPLADKLEVRSGPGGPGYQPFKMSYLASTQSFEPAPPDLKEGFRVFPVDVPSSVASDPDAAQWFLPNRWPSSLPEMRDIVVKYFRCMQELAGRLMEVFAVALGIPDDFFADKIDEHISHLSLLNYPAVGAGDALRAGQHTDYGSLTILAKEPGVGGLQIRCGSKDWVEVVAPPGGLIVNVGDLLAEWTNDRWVSTQHRVLGPDSDAVPRRTISLAFFHQPNYRARIAPIETCVSVDRPARYVETTSGEHMRMKIQRQEQGAMVS